MFRIHATKKPLDRVKQPVIPPVPEPTTAIALDLSETPCGPLYDRHICPDRELDALVAVWSEGRPGASTSNGSRQSGPGW